MLIKDTKYRQIVLAALAAMFLVGQAYGQADIYVTTDGTDPVGPSWAQPTSFTNALAIASASDVIWMKQGTYTSTSTFAIATSGLQIYGGFDGTESNLSERIWTNSLVLLDGDASHCVVDIQADNVLLDGLIITNGYEAVAYGAGIRMDDTGTGLTMLNCRVAGNHHHVNQRYGGGAYFNNAGNVLVSNCVFQGNWSSNLGLGAGFYSQNTTLTLLDSEIRGNYATADQRAGKGFYLNGGTLTMVRCTVADNFIGTDDDSGPGVGGYINSGTASFTNCIFTGNLGTRSDGSGLYVNGGDVTIDNCTFVDNRGRTDHSSPEGGAIYQNNGTLTIRNSIFWGNEAGQDADDGDTIYQAAGTLNISYCCLDGIDAPRVIFVAGTWGDGIITNNPLFATDYTDLHLKSEIGRWNGSSWVTDSTNSPCIDAGAPGSDFSNEPSGENGAWINMGAYGNTWQASKSTNEAPTVETVAERVVANAAELRGELTAGAVSTITFYYGLSNGLEDPANWEATNILSVAQSVGTTFASVAGSLQDSQTYWFTAYATNAFGDDWGTPRSFVAGTAAPGGGAGVIHVDADAVGVSEGLSWTNAFTKFEDALDAAEAGLGTSIWVAEGMYQSLNAFAVQQNGLSMYGGFDGTETLLSQRDWTNNESILNGENTRRVLDIQANDTLLDGLIITNGYITAGVNENGAGLRMESSGTGLTMLNCRVVNNYIADDLQYGGAIYLKSAGDVLVSNCLVNANRGYRTYGNGLYSQSTALTIMDSEIVGNRDEKSGQQRQGKGFYLSGGSLTMVGTTVADNYAPSGDTSSEGGGGYITGSTVSFTNCIFSGNLSQRSDGGGLYLNSGNITIENCTFADNGGWTNSPDPEGGAIFINSATVTIKNSIFWGNEIGNDANDGDTIYQNAGTLNISYSCLDGTGSPRVEFVSGTWGDGIITNDPLFATEYTDLHLKSTVGRWNGTSWVTDPMSSPCIDAGDPASGYSNEPTGEDGARINMGAYGSTWQASKSANDSPVVDTQAARVVANAAELKGDLTAGASSTITFYYGLGNGLEDPASWDATNVLSALQGGGDDFTSVAGRLQESQTYWFTVYATNVFGDDWGTPRQFTAGVAAPGGGAGVIHVDADAGGVPDGSSWTNAFTSFDDALAAADAGLGNSIWVAEGSYQSLAAYVVQTNGLSVLGGFSGTETNPGQRDWSNNATLLDGAGVGRVLDIQADDVLLDGLVITNGYKLSGNGGGVQIDSYTNLTMLNCSVVGNTVGSDNAQGGGAYFNSAGNVLLSNCVIQANLGLSRVRGAGFRSDNTTLTLLDCEVRGNYDTGGDQYEGKGFYLNGGTLTMVDTAVADNYFTANDNSGPGVGGYIAGGTALFTNCTFTGNQGMRNDGAGLYINNGDVTIESCTFAGNGGATNSPDPQGGAIYQNNGTLTIHNSIFWGNEAGTGSSGDTIYQNAGILDIGYSCLEGTNAPHLVALGTLTLNTGIITNDPLFVTEFTDVHLQSKGGHWNGSGWVADSEDSPCIDAGDPASDDSREVDGKRINMGAYGNTPEASRISKPGTILIIR